MQKRRSLREVADELDKPAAGRAKVVQCHGVFDLLHIGHIRHLQEARQLGDCLVVTITPDRFVNKGPHRPAFSDDLRAEALAALECVDFVCINEWPTAVEAIRMLRPDVFLKGAVQGTGPRDRNNAIDLEREAIESAGGKLVLTDTELNSASALINRHTDIFSPQLKDFLQKFRALHSAEQLVAELSQFKHLRTLVVGESFVEFGAGRSEDVRSVLGALGIEEQPFAISTEDRTSERYAGGAMAVANALSRFSDRVALLTAGIGDEVSPGFLSKNAAPGVDLEIVDAADLSSGGVEGSLDRLLDRYDNVLMSDWGTGWVSQSARAMIRARASFFAIDIRNPVSQASLDLPECGANFILQSIAAGQADNAMAGRLAEQHDCEVVLMIGDEAHGSAESATVVYDAEAKSCTDVPAFPVNPVNRVDPLGTREALFALTASCSARGLDPAAIGFIGNLAAAAATTTAGSGHPLEPRLIYRHIDSLLK
ncbi:MAG: adenylyltransferase/cytidyltransferase family protein [Myxococcales bacterium]|nr:adenylyltransferase/cytidyltransferase family protein [Myxococcales bacterium]